MLKAYDQGLTWLASFKSHSLAYPGYLLSSQDLPTECVYVQKLAVNQGLSI